MILWIVALGGVAIYVLAGGIGNTDLTDLTTIGRFYQVVLGLGFAVWALRLLLLSLHRPRITLDPLGLIDHSNHRGLLLWSDLSGAFRIGSGLIGIRPTSIYLRLDPDVWQRYNQSIPAWRRVPLPRALQRKSIKLRAVALDHNVRWVHAEINRRIAASRGPVG